MKTYRTIRIIISYSVVVASVGTGYVEFDEFRHIILKKMQEDEDERELRDIFRVLDKEKKGEVNVMELRWVV